MLAIEPRWHVSPDIHAITLDESLVDPDAAKVVRRLARHGHEAYLVGGCVRDLLLGRRPKDFDVATSACPDDVRTLFRNSRVIGRRFRLVHVLFGGGKVIETATFRCAPQGDEAREGEDLLIRDDNAFGDAHEDALRRDFTINGLFYDLAGHRVLDWVGGVPDIERRMVATIGDPTVRFQEDPVRMLRAIKFCARLDLGVSPRVYDAIVQCRGALAMAARPRLFEELLRLLREGAAHRSMWLAWETGLLDVLLPEVATYLSDEEEHARIVWRMLSALDRRAAAGGAMDDVVVLTTLLLEPMREACGGQRDRIQAAHEFLEPIIERLNMPRRIADAARRIAAILPRLETGRIGRISRSSLFQLAVVVKELRDEASAQASPVHLLEPRASSGQARRKRPRRLAPSLTAP
ncbi:MAG: polynucleotide adenylyltransferase PcnB [Polyangiaceae bacterium]|nr:polynucleotide adenylyltransferase PcnB [Polyangiaceae bacterium]